MGDVDAGTIKAKVVVEDDLSGIDRARGGIQSLADIVGGSLAESVGGANDALSSLDEQMGKSAESTAALGSTTTALVKPLQQSVDGISSVSEALGEQQSALEGVGTAYEELEKPVGVATVMLEDAAPSMLAVTQHAQSMVEQLAPVSAGFVEVSEALGDSVPLLPQFAASLQGISEGLNPHQIGLDNFNENMAVFQDALQNPYPFQMINQYLGETGQTWEDFSSSIGEHNAAFLDQMAAMPVVSEKAFSSVSSGVSGMGQTFYAAADQTEAFNKQWADLSSSLEDINKVGGVGSIAYGPAGDLGGEIGKISSISDMVGGFMGTLSNIAMPLMAVQMIGMAVGQVATGIYNMAALAEGPAAHSVGSFTGAVDQLGKSAQSMGEQFSESFGQGIKPMLDAMNNVQSQGGSNTSGIGSFLGGALNVLGDVAQLVGGAGLMGTPFYSSGFDMFKAGGEGLLNTGAGWLGLPEPFPTIASGSSSPTVDMAAVQSSIAQSIAMMNAQASSPGYLAAQAYLQSQGAYAAQGQAAYNYSHITGSTPFDYAPQSYQNSMMAAALASGTYEGTGISEAAFNSAYFQSMAAKLPPLPPFLQDELSGGCFPVGTPVLLADSTEKAIEALRIGDRVIAHDGARQVTTTVLALIQPPPRQVYVLTFSDGRTLTLTDSHPISTIAGWKSISPASTKQENPDLVVSQLHPGDYIHTIKGTCMLLSIEPRTIVQVYNITVGEPHTFYAGRVLVHNKAFGTQIMQNVADSNVPQMDMKNTNLIQSMMGNFTSADLTHTFTATVNWLATGDLNHSFIGNASWSAVGELIHTFIGNAGWSAVGELAHTFEGAASWVAQGGLQHTFEGAASWIASGGLQHTFEGLANWVGQGLTNLFTGKADWNGENLMHTFTGVASWDLQQITQVVGTIPGFASGVEGFAGGLAVVGEHGPELAYLPGGTSIYPQSTGGGFQPINLGIGDGGMISVTFNHTSTLNGKVVAQETVPLIAPLLRSQRGIRQ